MGKIMLKAYKYRLYPNLEQREYLVKTFGCTRFIYNKMLADKIEYYKETGEMLKNTPAQYKKEFEWLKEVDSLALANAQQNLEKAYKNFFRDKSIGFPKFKSKKTNYYSYTNKLSKVISEVAWSEFITMLEYKAGWYGRNIVVAPTNYASSQLCSECGYKNIDVKNLVLRVWTCPECGTKHDRDINASKNLEKLIA